MKPYELVMAQVRACIHDSHSYFTRLTYTGVQYKPFHHQLSKPALRQLVQRIVGVALPKWQLHILGTDSDQSAFKQVALQGGSSSAIHDALKEEFKGPLPLQALLS